MITALFLYGCSTKAPENTAPTKEIAIDNIQKALEKVTSKTIVVFTLNSLLIQQNETLITKERIQRLSRVIDRLQKNGIKVLLFAKLHPLNNLLGQVDIDLLKSYGYDFEKSWFGLKEHNFDGCLFTKGGLFFETAAELDYWARIERFIEYANIEITKVILVHEPGVLAIEDYRLSWLDKDHRFIKNIDTECIVAEN
ncbi:hypothetical protein FACS1894122_15180 [Alphaproteobacteria bacterium]|nr:hypothetical protein FACS1894122_15180 [Alphaproteobacteria bacterium]